MFDPFEDGISEKEKEPLFDARTSGGLLITLPADRVRGVRAGDGSTGRSPVADR
jgi:hypothetical protein